MNKYIPYNITCHWHSAAVATPVPATPIRNDEENKQNQVYALLTRSFL